MNQRGMLHPSMIAAIPAGVYPSLCTIRIGTGAQDAYGHVTPVTWGNMPGHVDVPCRVAPRGAFEKRQPDQVYAEASHTVSLAGYYPGIQPTMQAVVDNFAYDIEGVEHDGNRATTRLYVKVAF